MGVRYRRMIDSKDSLVAEGGAGLRIHSRSDRQLVEPELPIDGWLFSALPKMRC
jgi:hypothetical protein